MPKDVDISVPTESEYLIQEDKWFIPVEVVGDIGTDSKHGLPEAHIGIVFRIASLVVEAIQITPSQSGQIQQANTGVGQFVLHAVFDTVSDKARPRLFDGYCFHNQSSNNSKIRQRAPSRTVTLSAMSFL